MLKTSSNHKQSQIQSTRGHLQTFVPRAIFKWIATGLTSNNSIDFNKFMAICTWL